MVLPNENLRDERTGILLEARALLDAVLEQGKGRGIRDLYQQDRAVSALARVLRHVLDLVERPAIAAPGARGEPWRRPAAPSVEPETAAGRARREFSQLPDAVQAVLASAPDRWWTSREIRVAIITRRLCTTDGLTSSKVSECLLRNRKPRGWRDRIQPGRSNHFQYTLKAVDQVPA